MRKQQIGVAREKLDFLAKLNIIIDDCSYTLMQYSQHFVLGKEKRKVTP